MSFDTCDTSPTGDPECRSSWFVPDDDPLLESWLACQSHPHFLFLPTASHHGKAQAVALLRGVQSVARLLVLISNARSESSESPWRRHYRPGREDPLGCMRVFLTKGEIACFLRSRPCCPTVRRKLKHKSGVSRLSCSRLIDESLIYQFSGNMYLLS